MVHILITLVTGTEYNVACILYMRNVRSGKSSNRVWWEVDLEESVVIGRVKITLGVSRCVNLYNVILL